MQSISDKITVLLDVDDLLLIIQDVQIIAAQAVDHAKASLDIFPIITGVSVNLSKSAIFLKGFWPLVVTGSLGTTGLPIQDRYKYLGVSLVISLRR
mmetsp:Transcript_18403/g.32713  ORF Transcript_18403/g.32713 Transcript_18403/m.32713 type:complete len:96 (-) Transcript_18403:64-351(-)